MELAATASEEGVWPRISHTLRENNTWADQLTEHDFSGFCLGRRWRPCLHDTFFYVLDKLLNLQPGYGYGIDD